MKDNLLKKAVSWAKKRGFKKIKAVTENYDNPRTFTQSGSDEIIRPDMSGVRRGRKSYIEVAQKADDKQAIISKWKLFSTLAEMKGGKLYLLAARGHKAFAERIVKEHDLENAQIVSI
ncbi:MAG: hypothetical protein AB8F74_02945 [Saprospiraceae bacterium]